MGSGASDNDEIISENEDELERQLAELQRKLALKRKQTGSAPSSPVPVKPVPPALAPPQSPQARRDRGPPEIEVPKTPPRRRVSALHSVQQSPLKTPPSLGRVRLSQSPVIRSPTSPARVLLGIDKGLSGWDVSLKRPPKGSPQASPFASPKRPRESLQSSTQAIKPPSTGLGQTKQDEKSETLTFAQKLKKTKELDQLQKKKTQEMRDKRRQGFSIPTNAGHAAQDTTKPAGTGASGISRAAQTALAAAATSPDDIYEPFAHFRLSKQPALDFDTLKTQFGDAKILTVSQLYAEVSPPGFEPPQYCNWILVAVVAKKSKVMDRPSGGSGGAGGVQKFVMLTLTDLGAFEVALSVQGPAFEKYWKVSPGAVIAVLNPGIYQTRKKIFDPSCQNNDTTIGGEGVKTFGLFVTDASFTTILEIGHSKDLGKCAATTAKGHPCTNWVNARKATYCDFHAEARVRKARSGRMEMNSVAQGQPIGKYGLGSSKTVVMMSSGKLFHNSSGASGSRAIGPDYVNKSGLIDDPLAPGRKYSKEYGQVWTSVSSSIAGPGYQQPRSAFDAAMHGGDTLPLSAQAQKTKAAKLAKERRIREALMRRPDGVQLRYYDAKGNQLGFAGTTNPTSTTSAGTATKEGTTEDELHDLGKPRPAFRPEHIRRIGFNPTASISGGVPEYTLPALSSFSSASSTVTGSALGGGVSVVDEPASSNIVRKRPANVSEDVDLSITMTHKQRRLQNQQQQQLERQEGQRQGDLSKRACSESGALAAGRTDSATAAGVGNTHLPSAGHASKQTTCISKSGSAASSSVQLSPQKLKLKQMLANLSSSLKNDMNGFGDDDDDDDLEIV